MNIPSFIITRIALISLLFFILHGFSYSQVDTIRKVEQVKIEKVDEGDEAKSKRSRARRNEFKVFAGLTFNDLLVDNDRMESNIFPGFLLGAAYEQGRFFYWQLGVRYNNAVYDLKDKVNQPDTTLDEDGIFGVRRIDVPVNVGINLLSLTDRIVGLRIFAGAVPSFVLDVGDNNLLLTKDDMNSFLILGELGVEVSIAFFIIEVGYNYGFTDLIKDDVKSNPQQVFVNLGFRF